MTFIANNWWLWLTGTVAGFGIATTILILPLVDGLRLLFMGEDGLKKRDIEKDMARFDKYEKNIQKRILFTIPFMAMGYLSGLLLVVSLFLLVVLK